ncbi:MAG TPA: hypothetical protein P5340_05085, partial [Defluviicoccus sp.]|nr:hypothetical protein [Defluviicoccus sp.]
CQQQRREKSRQNEIGDTHVVLPVKCKTAPNEPSKTGPFCGIPARIFGLQVRVDRLWRVHTTITDLKQPLTGALNYRQGKVARQPKCNNLNVAT